MATVPAPPPFPLPRYARPGGYAQNTSAAKNPYAPQPGLLGILLGLQDNPIYQAVKPAINDLGYGLQTGTSVGRSFANAAQRGADMAPLRQQQALAATQFEDDATKRQSAARSIYQMGPDFQDIADAVSSGTVDAGEAWNTALKRKQEASALQLQTTRNQANSQFLKDPALREMVASGALDFQDAYKLERGGSDAGQGYGDTIIPGLDQDGNLIPMRAAPDGSLAPAAMPDGVRYAPDALAGARAGGGIDGKTVANAKAALPGAESALNLTLKAVQTLRDDKQGQAEQFGGLNRTFGATPGTAMANFQVNLEQAGGQAFLQVRNLLKGQGQITDFESRRAEAAYSRLETAAAKGDQASFNAALDDFEEAAIDGFRKLQEVANGTYQPSFTPGAPGSSIKDKYGLE